MQACNQLMRRFCSMEVLLRAIGRRGCQHRITTEFCLLTTIEPGTMNHSFQSCRGVPSAKDSIQTRQLANTRVRSSPPAAALRQDMPQRRTFMYGKSSAVGATVAAAQIIPRKAIFCIDNLSRSCSVDDIKSFVSSLSVKVLSCFEVKPRRRRGESEDDVANRKAFHLAINADQRERLLNESAWPNSVLISDWFFKPPADRRADDMRRRS